MPDIAVISHGRGHSRPTQCRLTGVDSHAVKGNGVAEGVDRLAL